MLPVLGRSGRSSGGSGGGGAGPALKAFPLVTTGLGTTSTLAVNVGATDAGDEIRIFVRQASGTPVFTPPANFDLIEEIVVNNAKTAAYRWNGTGTRPDGSSVTFTSSESRNSTAFSLIFSGAQQAEGVHGVIAEVTGSGQVTGPTGLSPSADSLIMHVWMESGSPILTINAPTTGFSLDAPATYPAVAGLLEGDPNVATPDWSAGITSTTLHWGSHGGGTYVPPVVTPSGFTRTGCITMEILAA